MLFKVTRLAAAGLLSGLLGAATVLHATPVEEQMCTDTLADFEFDSARDGTYCASCNYGQGNARISFIDLQYRIIVAKMDTVTGKFLLDTSQVVDINGAFVTDYGNGPSWMFSQRGSELVYSRYQNGKPRKDPYAGVAMARQVGAAKWNAAFIPGGLGRVSPKGTTDETDPVPLISYGNVSLPEAYWRQAVSGAPEVKLPGDDSNRGITLRWVPGTQEILLSNTPAGETDNQIFVNNTATGVTEQITSGPGKKSAQYMAYAPEFGGQAIAFTVVDNTRFDLYKRQADSQGVLHWTKFNTITMPAATPYISGSPEAFVYNKRTWIVLALRPTTGANSASDVAILSLDPARPELRILTNSTTQPPKWRSDPEYFINKQSVYIYYTRAVPLLRPTQGEGVWRVDTGLGPAVP